MTEKPYATYVTPKSPRQAVQNALVEIESEEQRRSGKLSHDEQAQIIVNHIRDYDGGKITHAMLKGLTLKDLVKTLFEWEDTK
jgi:hypothetical protein